MKLSNLKKMGSILKEYRLKKDYSLRDLEGKTGISFSHLSKIERGEYKPSRSNLIEICDKLDIPIAQSNEILLLAEYAPYEMDSVEKASHESMLRLLGEKQANEVAKMRPPRSDTRELNIAEDPDVQFIARAKKDMSPKAFQKMMELAKKAKEMFEDDEDDN